MGTSQSSGGPGSGVPLVPAWADPPAPEEAGAAPTPAADQQAAPPDGGGAPEAAGVPAPPALAATAPPPIPMAAPARFRGARRSLGDFAKTGDAGDMRRGVGRYVKTGYNGSSTATRRMGSTSTTAGALHGALSEMASGQPAVDGNPLDPALLAGRSVAEVINAVVEAVRPVDGTQDAEAGRAAIRDALSELLTRFPGADLLNLDEEQRAFAIERYTALDVFRRLELDLGKTILEKAPSATTALSRLKQVRDYVKETVAAAFRNLRDAGRPITSGRVSQVVRDALLDTFQVFEGYAE